MQSAHDPSLVSYYVTDAFYRELIANFSDWQRDELAIADLAERDLFRRLLDREARLLDQLRYEEWLKLFAAECIYWVPATPHAGDPRREVAVMFDDRRRLEDRVFRLRTGFAWSQAPASRTAKADGRSWPSRSICWNAIKASATRVSSFRWPIFVSPSPAGTMTARAR